MYIFNSGFNYNSPLPPRTTGKYDGIERQIKTNGLQYPFSKYDYSGDCHISITGVHDGDRRAALEFFVSGETNLSGFRFLATIDDIYYGCFRPYQEPEWIPSGFANVQVAGLSNTEKLKIDLRAIAVTYDESGYVLTAYRGPKSRQVKINPEPITPETSGVFKNLQFEKGDLVYSAAKTFGDSNFDYSSQYSYDGTSYDPIPFTPNVAVGVFYASAKINARFIDGTEDFTRQWFIDYNINSVNVSSIKKPFTFLIARDGGRGIAEAFNAERTLLGKNNPDMDKSQERIIEYRLRHEYDKAKHFLKEKLNKMLMQNPTLLTRNLPTYRRLLDLIVGDNVDLNPISRHFSVPYIGIIYLNPKIICAHHADATSFNYNLKNIRGKNIKQGQSNLAILTNYPQDFSYFSLLPLYSIFEPNQVLGSENMTDSNL
jgi:hypothetical protein